MDKFIEMWNLPKLNKEEPENLNRPITTNKIKIFSTNKSPGLGGFTVNFAKHSKKN